MLLPRDGGGESPRCTSRGGCQVQWSRVGDALVGQCTRRWCRRVVGVVTAIPPPFGLSPRALDALQNTSGMPAPDWPGCID